LIKIEQTIEAISFIISYFNFSLLLNDLLKQSLEYIQLESGLASPILLASFDTYSHMITKE